MSFFAKNMLSGMRFLLPAAFLCVPVSAEPRDQSDVLLDSLLAHVPAGFAEAHLAVMPFTAPESQSARYGVSIAEYLVSRLQTRKAAVLVDRISLKKALDEIALSQSGIIDEKDALKIGRVLSADCIMVGVIAPAFGRLRITATVLKTETGEVMASASTAVEPGEYESFTRDILGEAGKTSAVVFRSAVVPGWGQFYADEKTHGSIAFSAFAASLGYTCVTIYQRSKSRADYEEYHNYMFTPRMSEDIADRMASANEPYSGVLAEFEKKEDALYDTYSLRHDRMVIMSVVTGVLWSFNIVDAAIIGKKNKRKFDLYFSSVFEKSGAGIALHF